MNDMLLYLAGNVPYCYTDMLNAFYCTTVARKCIQMCEQKTQAQMNQQTNIRKKE